MDLHIKHTEQVHTVFSHYSVKLSAVLHEASNLTGEKIEDYGTECIANLTTEMWGLRKGGINLK